MGKRALVTGAASGIGAACVQRVAQAGAERCVLVDRKNLDRDALGLAGIECVMFCGDVADPALWDEVETSAGPLDWAVVAVGLGILFRAAKNSFR